MASTDKRALGAADNLCMSNGTDCPGLSSRQRDFADRMDCGMAVPCVDESVCFYRVIAESTIRWIVDADGSIIDRTVFHSGG